MYDNPIDSLRMMVEEDNKELDAIDVEETNIDTYISLFIRIANRIRNSIFLKGNVLLNKLYSDIARSTIDLDIGLINKELYDTVITEEFKLFGDELIQKNIACKYSIRDIKETRNGGIDVFNDNGDKIYAVDVSLDDNAMFGIVEYTFDGINILGSSTERIICDKCLSTLSRRRFKRVKDFFDLYLLLTADVKYDIKVVFNLMVGLCGIEEVTKLLKNYPFDKTTIASISTIWDKFNVKNTLSGNGIEKESFTVVYSRLSVLYANLKVQLK